MSEIKKRSKNSKDTRSVLFSVPMLVGYVLTFIVFLFFFYSMNFWPRCEGIGPCRTNWDYLKYSSSPNEIGDTLAGFAGSLAFVWLVVTVLLQSKELREQREEFEAMADAQSAQADIFAKEQIQRKQEIAARKMDAYCELLAHELSLGNLRRVRWTFQDSTARNGPAIKEEPFSASQYTETEKQRLQFETLARQAQRARTTLLAESGRFLLTAKSKGRGDLESILLLLRSILSLKEELREDRRLQLKIWKIEASYNAVFDLFNADVWLEEEK